MDPNNPANNPQDGQAPPQSPIMGMPQSLNTSLQTPTEMPMGEPTPPPQNGGLPPELPGSPQVSKAPGGSGMFMLMSAVAVILVILGIGVYYFYTNMGKSGNKQTPQTPESSRDNQSLTGLAAEVNGIDLVDPEKDLEEIDQEIILLEATPSSR